MKRASSAAKPWRIVDLAAKNQRGSIHLEFGSPGSECCSLELRKVSPEMLISLITL